MVRFSDMLGGSGEPEDGRAASSPFAELAGDNDEPESEAVTEAVTEEPEETVADPDFESPEAVLARLTQYATSARAADHVATVDEPELDDAGDDDTADDEQGPDDPLTPMGDDFLPHPKGVVPRPAWGRKRRP